MADAMNLETDYAGRERSVYERLRDDIIEGAFQVDERMKVVPLSKRYGVSTVPVREALQRLHGEGFVTISPNRGARVRRIDVDFLRDVSEFEVLIEPHLTRGFVKAATARDIAELERIQARIEQLNFADPAEHFALDTAFHKLMYEKHHNRRIFESWWTNRHILRAVVRGQHSLARQATIVQQHRAIIEAVRAHDEEAAARIVAEHVAGSGAHWVERMRLDAASAGSSSHG